MVSLMLSSQTKDEVTSQAMGRLKNFGLTPKNIADADESTLANLIHPVGFWQVGDISAIYILCTVDIQYSIQNTVYTIHYTIYIV